MVHLRLDIAYQGTPFHGWAKQPGLDTVQGRIEAALALISRQPVQLTVAGRTDTGVHARGQVASLDFPDSIWCTLARPGKVRGKARGKVVADDAGLPAESGTLDQNAQPIVPLNDQARMQKAVDVQRAACLRDRLNRLVNQEAVVQQAMAGLGSWHSRKFDFRRGQGDGFVGSLGSSSSLSAGEKRTCPVNAKGLPAETPKFSENSQLDSRGLPEDARGRKQTGAFPKPNHAGAWPLVIRAVSVVPADFDARFSALSRQYCYRICDQVSLQDPTRVDVAQVKGPLDLQLMQQGAQAFVGEHDFLPFAKPRPGASTVRTLQMFEVERLALPDLAGSGAQLADGGLVVCRIKADAFCHSQVRFMVGTLIKIGQGAYPSQLIADLLAGGVRDQRVQLAAAGGLTLEQVTYPAPEAYASQAQAAKVFRTLNR